MTDQFVETARQMAAVQGVPDYPFVVIPHPIAGNTDAELWTKAEEVLPRLVALLTTRVDPSRTPLPPAA
jgi:hypothetical protein